MTNPKPRAAPLIGLLLLVNILNFVDRQLPFILIDSIKAELRFSDSQIGVMAGLAFALVYSFASLPLAQAADRWSPRWVLTLSLGVWSGMTALSGLATSFAHLLLARIGVAASEAGATPSSHAIISRLVAPERRAVALAVFSLGVPIGSMIGLVLGGWINDVAGWRTAFFFVGAPGLMLAVIARLALPRLPPVPGGSEGQAGFQAALRALAALPAFRWMAAGSAFYACGSYAINVFAAAFLMRVHHVSTAEAGLRMGLVFGVGGLIGTFLGGVLGDRLSRRDPSWRQTVPAIGQWLSLPTALLAWLAPDVNVATGALALSYLAGLLYFAPTFAALQAMISDNMRATASAVLLFCLTLVGSSVGPLAVGAISDVLARSTGAHSLRYALCAMAVTITLSALCFHRAAWKLREGGSDR